MGEKFWSKIGGDFSTSRAIFGHQVKMNITEIDYSRKWTVMAAVSMGTLLATIDGSIVNVALPSLVRELGTDFSTVQWVVL
ncbi:MAG: hypothetical protein P8046_02315, partial [Anaerolineales bacterium]